MQKKLFFRKIIMSHIIIMRDIAFILKGFRVFIMSDIAIMSDIIQKNKEN